MLINGVQAQTIDATDRGLAYGDGLFSTLKVCAGVVQLWDLHLQRLQRGAQALFFPHVDWQQLTAEVQQVANTLHAQPVAVLKIILTRGSGGRGYSTSGCESPQRIISTGAYPEIYQDWQRQGIAIIQCETELASHAQLAGLKTLNRLEQVLIKRELESKGALEGIVCDNQGNVIEACSANVFVLLDDCWHTPSIENSGVAGVLRRHLLSRAAQAGVKIIETQLHRDRLQQAQAICLSNALMGVVPVSAYECNTFDSASIARCQQLQMLIE